jgi:hypothetical protein
VIPVRTLLVLLLALSTLLGPAAPRAQETGKEPAKTSPTLESARARWERFTPAEKERARARYERFLAMSEEEREQLVESARRLRERADRVSSQLAEKEGDKLAKMDPEKRHALVRELVADESRAVGARIRGQFPEDWLKRLENAKPQDRARFFRQFRIKQRDRVARYAIGELGKRLELAPEEIARMQELPGEDRCEAALDLRKRLEAQEVHASGLPPGITQTQWDAWLALPPEEFFEVFQRYRESRIFARAKQGPARESTQALHALYEASRPHPEQVLALSDLPPAERHAKVVAERRRRCIQALRDGRLLPQAELDALDGKSDAEVFGTVHRVLWQSAKPAWLRRWSGQNPR